MRLLLFLLIAVSPFALAHRLDGSSYSGHDANQCSYADGNTGGSVSCSDPLANPCDSGRSTSAHTPNSRGHSHAGFPANKSQTQACQDYLARLNPPPVVDPPPPPSTCEHGDACDGYGEHEADEHDCAVCDEQDGTCGWHSNHRHPGQCENVVVDPPPPPPPTVKNCECCPGVSLSAAIDADCPTECASLLRQEPAACEVPPPPLCAHGEACDSWGEHEEDEHLCDVCDERDGTCGWLDGHRHPGQCANDPNWVDPNDPPVVDPPVVDPPADDECPVCPVCPSAQTVTRVVTNTVEVCPTKPRSWRRESWRE